MHFLYFRLNAKNILTVLTLVALVCPPLAYAQEAGDSVPVAQPEVVAPVAPETSPETSLPAEEIATPPVDDVVEEIVVTQVEEEVAPATEEAVEEVVVLQEASDVQQTVTTDMLEDTTGPLQVAEVPEGETVAIVVVEEVVTEESPVEDVTPSEVVAVIEQTQEEVPMVEPGVPDPVVTEMPVAELAPEPEFSFSLSEESVPTKKKVRTSRGIAEEEVSTKLVPTVDNEKGELLIGGECSDVSFVVLLFKNEEDYARDPASYIVNRAYPCENGSFSYALSSLPSTLPDGTYYLLVGQQGDRGMWTPITELRAVTINNSLR
jgi:hypothetical protein